MRNAAGHRTPGTARAPKRDTHPESGGGGRSMTPGRFPPVLAAALLAVTALVGSLVVTGGDAQAQSSVPAAPTGLSTSSVSYDAVSLAWDDPADAAITGYQVLRRSRDGDAYGDGRGAAEFVAVVADTASPAASYTDTTVTARTRYVYRVKAINPAGLGARSSYLNVETPDAPTTPTAQTAPARPTGLSASPVTHDAVSLAWDDPGDAAIGGYQVLRRSRDGDAYGDGRGAWEFVAVVADTASPATSYTDTTVTARTRYVYRVKAINPAGLGPRSSYLNIDTPDAPENSEPEPETTETRTEAPEPVATEVLVTEPPEDEPQTAQQTLDPGTLTTTIWTTTMTVGVSGAHDRFAFQTVNQGYLSGAVAAEGFGGLDDDTFDYNGHTYTVLLLAGEQTGILDENDELIVGKETFWFTVGESGDPRLGADLVLYVGDQSFHLDDAERSPRPFDLTGDREFSAYRWGGSSTLVDGEAVAVRLVEELPPVPAPETIWSTTMTAGAVARGPFPRPQEREAGYTRVGDASGHLGGIDDDTFDYDGDTYTVHQIRRVGHTVVRNSPGVHYGSISFHVTVDDHGNDFSDLALDLGGSAPIPFADAASSVTNLGSDRVRTFVFSDHIPWFAGGQRVAVRIERLAREFRGPDGYPVSARLAVGDEWVDQTYPNVCGGLEAFYTCRLPDADSQWFVVRLKDNRRYVVEVDTEANNHRPRLRHIAPSWNTDRRLSFTDQFDNAVPYETFYGTVGLRHTGGTDMLYLDTNADSLRGGDYLVRVRHNGYSVKDPDYRIRIREQQ